MAILFQVLAPVPALALTDGPTQTEFKQYTPVGTTDMVNAFTGDFNYNLPILNIPGANGGGYPLSLSYTNETSMEAEASWVGLGWNLNPGSIQRNKRGFPDDWKGESVKYWNKVPDNWTVTYTNSGQPELFSQNIPTSVSGTIRYNNYQGFGYSGGVGATFLKGVISLGYHTDNGTGSFSASVSPVTRMKSVKKIKIENPETGNVETVEVKRKGAGLSSVGLISSSYGLFTYGNALRSVTSPDYVGASTNLSINGLPTVTPFPAGVEVGASGSFSVQANTRKEDVNVFGYMYSDGAEEQHLQDYATERSNSYNKNDRYIGLPVANADGYFAAGEGALGGFRIVHKKEGHFRPNRKNSPTVIANLGLEFEAGGNLGLGNSYEDGIHTFTVAEWQALSNYGTPNLIGEEEQTFFRFNNDPGGEINRFTEDAPQRAAISYQSGLPGGKKYGVGLPVGLQTDLGDERNGRSSYIGYSFNRDFDTGTNTEHRVYNKRQDVEALVDRGELPDQVGEFSVVNEEGSRYTYGLPVYARNERTLQFGLAGLAAGNIHNRYLAYKNVFPLDDQKTVVGEEAKMPYATQYLLTEVTDADYIDRKGDGVTPDDFGGYTKFSYWRAYGSKAKKVGGNWYRWRSPFRGLRYSRNSLSDPKDDLGSFSDGEKEVYYLDTIETKTHFAVFFVSDRRDGRSATDEVTAASDSTAKGVVGLQKLDKIELYAKGKGDPELIKRVCFAYDYSLCPGVPNNDGQEVEVNGVDLNKDEGKLTLKKVWFEYDKVVEARISPYEFCYKYPKTADGIVYPSPYEDFDDYQLTAQQNPPYLAEEMDAWGNYQLGGDVRYERLQPWVNQQPADNFDPAAWQLKRIRLPSGGEIHVQYEQDDYRFVQDKTAMVMTPLQENGSSDEVGSYYIDHTAIGIDENELPDLAEAIERQLIGKNKERLYFKFLYRILGEGSDPDIGDCNAEYLTGYVKVKEVGITGGNRLYLRLGRPNSGLGPYELPRNACVDFVKTQRRGKLSEVASLCDPEVVGIDNTSDPVDALLSFVTFAATAVQPGESQFCREVNLAESYFRLPVIKDKLGGGVRVKRLLLYDQGLDAGYPSLFGSEYHYETPDPRIGKGMMSSGVATNEPGTIRDENTLVQFLDREEQKWREKIIAGKDREVTEGPIGESYLPAPSVGYSRVVVSNIHIGKTNPGYEELYFHTAQRYPLKVKHTELDKSNKDYLPLSLGLFNRMVNNQWLAQGFTIETNNMHGQPNSVRTYAGRYEPEAAPPQLSSQQDYQYLYPGDPVNYWNGFGKDASLGRPGREEELVFATNKTADKGIDRSVEADVDVGLLGIIPLPFLTFFPSATITETELYSHATVKVIRHPTVVTGSRTYQDGIYHDTRHRYYDEATGRPIVTETYDGFDTLNLQTAGKHDGRYTQFGFAAYQDYPALGPKAANERKLVVSGSDNVAIAKQKINSKRADLVFTATSPDADICGAMGSFSAGDLVEVDEQVFHTGDPVGSRIPLYLHDGQLIAPTMQDVNVGILKSGRSNQLKAQVGSVTTYGAYEALPTEPTPPSVMGPRQEVATLLNNVLAGQVVSGSDFPAGLTFRGADGSCAEIPPNCFMRFYGNKLIIYENVDDVNNGVVGSPGNPHPMVQALNHYQTTFYNYQLDDSAEGADEDCFYDSDDLIATVPNTRADVAFMRQQQLSVLNREFDCVNDGRWRIADFFRDVDATNGEAVTGDYESFWPRGRFNKSVVLEHLGTGQRIGRYEQCGDDGLEVCVTSCEGVDPICTPYNNEVALPPAPVFAQDEDGYLVINDQDGNLLCSTDIRFYCATRPKAVVKCETALDLPTAGGSFRVNLENGRLELYGSGNDCYPVPQTCLQFCEDAYPKRQLTQVVAASARTMGDAWDYEETEYFPYVSGVANDYATGRKGQWRPVGSYVFKSPIAGINTPYDDGQPYLGTDPEKNYNAGTYTLDLFNYKYLGANDPAKWLKMNTVTQYSPHGQALEEENILGIKSCAHFGYEKTLPYAIAQNAAYDNLLFEGFENEYAASSGGAKFLEGGRRLFEDEGETTVGTAHSGQQSLRLKATSTGWLIGQLAMTEQLRTQGLSAKVWVKAKGTAMNAVPGNLTLRLTDGNTGVRAEQVFERVAQTGEWELYEAKLTDWPNGVATGDDLVFRLYFDYGTTGVQDLWVDDLRLQPLDATATCYVYDTRTLRLLTTFDDQHFGTYYQYNKEGELVRQLVETERGMKTVRETQINVPKKSRQ